MVNRMLKLVIQILKHRLSLGEDLLKALNEVQSLYPFSQTTSDEEMQDSQEDSNIEKAFSLTIRRLAIIKEDLETGEIEQKLMLNLKISPTPTQFLDS
jgi:hypothetical protein